jgi:hypothetical protein
MTFTVERKQGHDFAIAATSVGAAEDRSFAAISARRRRSSGSAEYLIPAACPLRARREVADGEDGWL